MVVCFVMLGVLHKIYHNFWENFDLIMYREVLPPTEEHVLRLVIRNYNFEHRNLI
jgi:hypothetical protein